MKIQFRQALEAVLAPWQIRIHQLHRDHPVFSVDTLQEYPLLTLLDHRFGKRLFNQLKADQLGFYQDESGFTLLAFYTPHTNDAITIIGPWLAFEWTTQSAMQIQQTLGRRAMELMQQYAKTHQTASDQLPRIVQALLEAALNHAVSMKKEPLLESGNDYIPAGEELFTPGESVRKILEEKAGLEKQLLEDVSFGSFKEAAAAWHQIMDLSLMQIHEGDPVQLMKKLLFRYNVLFSHAVSSVNVHPAYIDELYRRVNAAIEKECRSMQAAGILAERMIREYCSLIHNLSLKDYSPLIQNAINYINLNIDQPLALNVVAQNCHISPSYLSALFRKETGITLTEFIAEKRVEIARNLLVRSNESITSIAAKVGFSDINYFTRTFKKVSGMTPSAFREENRSVSR